ncbi:MAG: carbohydrate-binding domain-containing protein, partial [Muribaculaceae bacterium]|nr:carbohydrate-binding domain-containing protein [Muribaculaceae bacterium]
MPDFDTTIYPYQGQTTTDADKDIVGTDADIYWEANTFKNKVTVAYSGNKATVETNNQDIRYEINDAHVVIDMLSNSVSGVEINLSGASDNGSLKIYDEKKLLLNLNGVELTSKIGPAINNQCKKRMFVNLKDGSVNKLTDASSYSNDPYYLNGALPDDEDRKGCMFSEGNLIFSGYGSLIVTGKKKHGIASDGYMYLRPGTTIAVTEAAKNAIHIKGDKSEDIGIIIAGGLIYTLSESEAGKGLKTDYHVDIRGGQLDLNTKGAAIYEEDENDTSSAAGIKTDGNVIISGGDISIKSTGTGGKGINADGSFSMTGGKTTVVTTGGKFVYNAALDLDSSPKGIKADGDITIDDGQLNIMVTGVSDGTEGLESKSELTINGGVTYIYAYDDAINASTGITINDGRIYAYAVNNDAIDSNGYMNLNGGLVIAAGASGSEESFDCEYSNRFLVNGGTLIGTAGNAMNKPSSSSKQRVVIYG